MIQTPRLILRPAKQEDEAVVLSLLMSDEFMVFSSSGAMDLTKAKARFSKLIDHHRSNGFGRLIVEERSSGSIVGYCGIEECTIDGNIECELGYRLSSQYRGLGYATEAAAAVIQHEVAQGRDRLVAFTEPNNDSSINVLEKIGFEYQKESFFNELSVLLYKYN